MNEMSLRIYNKRKEFGYTMEELAQKVGVTKSTVNKWEKGQVSSIRSNTIAKLADVLRCNPIWLMGYGEDDDSMFEKDTDYNGFVDLEDLVQCQKDSNNVEENEDGILINALELRDENGEDAAYTLNIDDLEKIISDSIMSGLHRSIARYKMHGNTMDVSREETDLIFAYRKSPAHVQTAIRTLLGL